MIFLKMIAIFGSSSKLLCELHLIGVVNYVITFAAVYTISQENYGVSIITATLLL
jgi:hypothetical protein